MHLTYIMCRGDAKGHDKGLIYTLQVRVVPIVADRPIRVISHEAHLPPLAATVRALSREA